MMDISKLPLEDRKCLILLHRFAKLQREKKSIITALCPRCGAKSMDDNVYRNALSRRADIQVCDLCGTQEAILGMTDSDIPLSEWWIVKWFEGREVKDD